MSCVLSSAAYFFLQDFPKECNSCYYDKGKNVT